MKQNYIWLRTYCKQFLATFIIALTVSASFAQTYVNGNIGTSATSNNGTAAPAGTTWHELQHNTGSTTESNSLLGTAHSSFGTNNFALADNITVPPGVTWTLSTLRVYALDQVVPATGTTSPYNNIRVRIWNGVPGATGSTVVFGDMTTNRFASTAFSLRKGIFNSLVPTPGAPTPNLPIFSIDATVVTALPSGTYWIEWQVVHTANSFSPTSQTIGVRTIAGYNAIQRTGAVWAPIIDGGSPATAPDVAVDLPFSLTYTAGAPVACSGTPAPGNTISTAAAVCPNTPFTLSLQNLTPGTGVTYQWQSASTLTGTYTNIVGATNPTHTVTGITATTFYRAQVTCAGNTGTSNPVQVTANSLASCGCTSSATSTADEDIFNVSFGSLNQSSTCATTGTGPGSVINRYSNYTSGPGAPAAPVLLPGTSYPLSVQIGTCGGIYQSGIAVFIDYNQNGLLTDAGERIYFSPAAINGPHTATANITIPIGAATGSTLMRVVNVEITTPNTILPCGTYTWGETEDYLVNIGALTPCTGTPSPGATNSTSTSPCATVPFTLTPANNTMGSGVSYQWQSSSTAGGPFTNIAGATSGSHTTAVSNTFYQVVVTCGTNSGTSTPVFVATAPFFNCYCASSATSNADEEIFNVTVSTLNNTSNCTTLAPGPGSVVSRYSNYTSGTGAPAAPDLVQGLNAPFSVQIGTCGGNFGNAIAIFIDLNQNGLFTDAGERVYVSPTAITGPHVATGSLVIPANAFLGITRMRVVNVETAPNFILPCGTYTWGETEDYLVNIIPCVPAAITGQPANASAACGSNATFTVTTTGTVASFQWQYRVNATSPWITVPNAPPYSGANTATLTVMANTSLNGYQFRAIVNGACTGADFSAPATLTVTALQLAITPAIINKCLTAAPVLISAPSTQTVVSGTNNTPVPVPDNTAAGANSAIAIAGIPAGATIQRIDVRFNMPHTYVGDMIFNLRAPNNQILNLVKYMGGTGNQAGTYPNIGFVNTVISSAGTVLLSSVTTQPVTGTFRADAINVLAGFPITNPTGFVSNAANFPALYSVPNGTWTLAMADGGPADIGTLTNWTITITYGGAPATVVFTPTAGLFTDAAGTIPYTGGAVTQVYAAPTTTTTYAAVITAGSCSTAPQNIVVNVNTPATGTPVLNNVSACNGSAAVFNVSGLTGGNGLSYQLQVNTIAAPTVFTNVGNASSTPTFTIPNVGTAQNGLQYRVIVTATGCTGPVTSAPATLTVNPTPVVTISAAPRVNLFPGLTTTLTAAVSSATAPVTYQWFRNGVLVTGVTGNMITVGIDQLGTYTVKATDANGCSSTTATTTPGSITIGDSTGVTTLFIYPSPNNGQFQVRYFNDVTNTSQTPATVNVYDGKGSRVYTRTYTVLGSGYQALNVNLGAHGRGLYRVELISTNGDRIKTGSVMVF